MIRLTEAATTQITKLCTESDGYDIGLRLEVVSGGCSGFQYKFSMVGLITKDEERDIIIGTDGSALFIDPTSAEKIDGATVDYVIELMSQKFTVTNPNSNCCGCGESFT